MKWSWSNIELLQLVAPASIERRGKISQIPYCPCHYLAYFEAYKRSTARFGCIIFFYTKFFVYHETNYSRMLDFDSNLLERINGLRKENVTCPYEANCSCYKFAYSMFSEWNVCSFSSVLWAVWVCWN